MKRLVLVGLVSLFGCNRGNVRAQAHDAEPTPLGSGSCVIVDPYGSCLPCAVVDPYGHCLVELFELAGAQIFVEPGLDPDDPRLDSDWAALVQQDLSFNGDALVDGLADHAAGLSWTYAAPPNDGSRKLVLRRPAQPVSPDPFDLRTAQPSGLPREGFVINIKANRINVRSADPRGQRYAVQWLLENYDSQLGGWVEQRVRDAPAMRLRMVHFGNKSMSEVGAWLDDVAAARMNVVAWELRNRVALDSSGVLLQDRAYSKDDIIQQVVLEAARRHIIVVPALKLLTHQEKLFADRADSAVCAGRNVRWCVDHNYPDLLQPPGCDKCVYDPTYELQPGENIVDGMVLPMVDELVDLFSSVHPLPAVMVGHDEAARGGLQAVADAKGGTAAQLYADHVVRVHDHLSSRGVRTLMWGDMLLDPTDTRLAGMKGGIHGDRDGIGDALEILEQQRNAGGLDQLIIGDWHYNHPDENYPSNDILADPGFDVFGAGWKVDHYVLNFVRDQMQVAPAMAATMWGTDTWNLAGNQHIVEFSGDAFWTGGNPTMQPNRWPHASLLQIVNAAGTPTNLVAPGENVKVWVKGDDNETPDPELRDFTLYYKYNGQSAWTEAVTTARFDAAGPGGGMPHNWVLSWTVPSTGLSGSRHLLIFYTDAEGLPNATTHDRALYVGSATGGNLLSNSGFETRVGSAVGNWSMATGPNGIAAVVSSTQPHSGAKSVCLTAIPCTDCGYAYYHTRQRLDDPASFASDFVASGWLKASGREEPVKANIDLVARDANGDAVCWPGKSGQFCNRIALPSSEGDHGWLRFARTVSLPSGIAQLVVRLRQYHNSGQAAPRGEVCFDDVELIPVSPPPP